MNALLGLLFGLTVVFGRSILWYEHFTQERQRKFYILCLVFFACCCFLIFVIVAALVLVPARRERRRVARQLRTFDVRQAEAWSAADKLYVLEKVRGWYGDGEEALNSFNRGPQGRQPAPARHTRLRMRKGLRCDPACLRQPSDPPWSPSGHLWGTGVPSTRSQCWALGRAFEHACRPVSGRASRLKNASLAEASLGLSRLQKERPHGWRGGPRQSRDERRFV